MSTMTLKKVAQPPAIKRNRASRREATAQTAATHLIDNPKVWYRLGDTVEQDKRGTLANRRRELRRITVPEGQIEATTRSEGNGKIGLYARFLPNGESA